MTAYQPGSFFVVSVQGVAGWGIGVAQAFAGRASEFEHAGMIVSADGATVEAEAGGARRGNVADYAGRHILISDSPIQCELALFDAGQRHWGGNRAELEQFLRAEVVANAEKRIGRKYSFVDYGSLILFHLGLSNRWIRGRIASSGHELCSQSVDGTFLDSDMHLFDDHPYRDDPRATRLPGDVMPADLAAWAEDHQQVTA